MCGPPDRAISTYVPSTYWFGRLEPPRAGIDVHLDILPLPFWEIYTVKGSFMRNALSQIPFPDMNRVIMARLWQ